MAEFGARSSGRSLQLTMNVSNESVDEGVRAERLGARIGAPAAATPPDQPVVRLGVRLWFVAAVPAYLVSAYGGVRRPRPVAMTGSDHCASSPSPRASANAAQRRARCHPLSATLPAERVCTRAVRVCCPSRGQAGAAHIRRL